MSTLDASAPAESGTPQPRGVWGPWSTAGFGLGVVVAYLVTQGLVGVIFAAALTVSSGPTLGLQELARQLKAVEGLIVALSVVGSTVIGVGLIAVIAKVRGFVSIAEYLGLRRITGKTVLALLAITLGLVVLGDSLSLVLGRPINPQSNVDIYRTSVYPPLLWLALLVFAPAFEETFFRGFLFEGFRQSRIGVAATIVLMALAWSLLHTQYDVYDMATIFVAGILLGMARFKTGSLWSPLLMHSFMNFIATLEVAINVNALTG